MVNFVRSLLCQMLVSVLSYLFIRISAVSKVGSCNVSKFSPHRDGTHLQVSNIKRPNLFERCHFSIIAFIKSYHLLRFQPATPYKVGAQADA